MMSIIVPFFVYWLVLFAACYIVTEYSQKYLYDEVTPHVGWKIAGGAAILAALLVWTKSQYDTMFTSEVGKTVLQAIVWFLVFTFVFQFQPLHGASLGIVTMVVVAGLATMGVQSLTAKGPSAPTRPPITAPRKPLRMPVGPSAPPAATPKAEPPKP